MRKRNLFVIAYFVCALIGYLYFIDFSRKKWREEVDIETAELMAELPSLRGFEPDYFFFDSVWGRNIATVGCFLWFGSALVHTVLSGVLDRRKNTATNFNALW